MTRSNSELERWKMENLSGEQIDELKALITQQQHLLLDRITPEYKTDESDPIDEWLEKHPNVSPELDHNARLQVAASRVFGYNDAVKEQRQAIQTIKESLK